MRLAAIIIIQFLALTLSYAQRPKLYVFLPGKARAHFMQENLSEACPNIDITVFGRYRDFSKLTESGNPEAILVAPEVLNDHPEYKVALQGLREGSSREPLVLLSVDKEVDLSGDKLPTIGIVSLLDNKDLAKFASEKLKTAVRIKVVAKLEDLLSLLQFQNADAVLIAKDHLDYFQQKSRLNFFIKELEGESIGLPVLAVGTEDTEALEALKKAFTELDNRYNTLLRVENWRVP